MSHAEDFLIIGGLTPLTTVDFPNELACIVFCQGCMWKCPYCHNSHLRGFKKDTNYTWDNILDFLHKRKNWLTAIVFSGGEPTLQKNLIPAIKQVKELGLKVGLHTTGCLPEVFKECLPLIDWVGLDIKTVLDERYKNISGHEGSHLLVLQSLKYLLSSGIDYELRLTLDPRFVSEEEVEIVREQLKSLNTKPLKIQEVILR